ncbi:asparagine synthase-related protein [Paenibacillus sp. SYP-B4298]|uniref:asparagine synthase-related protein n=1 Tax=Paenibacillus sp. SYP-B4298 TaxID=2996034 RepID=UPI0022DD85A0|nr:asparagine synthase-related protein [Paenibacillus sp. SYP-B4298]
MSALGGVIGLNGEPVSPQTAELMQEALQPYAGDALEHWEGDRCFLACRALWLTSESIGSSNPCHDPASGLVVVADAMLDNRDELFEAIGVPGKQRFLMSDTELILRSYLRWGEHAPSHLLGDFAFVVWDVSRRRLFGARDLCGNRTLYYTHGSRQFAFSSAIAPLLTLPCVSSQLDEAWLAEFMAIQVMFESADSQATAYADVRQLPPAHSFLLDEGRLQLRRYGTLLPEKPLQLHSNGEYEEAFREVLKQAVQCRLRTYRQVGVTLSGGLDSGIVASYAARELKAQGKLLHAFSHVPARDFVDWTARSRAADETPYIEATLNHIGNTRANYVECTGESPLSGVNQWLDTLEMPYKYFENSFWVKGIFERARGEGVGVLLTGAKGNNTISWGPVVDYYAELLKQFRWIRLYKELYLYGKHRGIRRTRLLSLVGRRLWPWQGGGRDGSDTIPPLIAPEFARRTAVWSKLNEAGISLDNGSRLSSLEARREHFENLAIHNMTGNKSSKLSLRYGIWERDPTCDARVVRFCLSVPMQQYVQNGLDRALIRRAAKHDLPDAVRLNYRVRGVQGADWLHRSLPAWPELLAELEQLCDDPQLSAYMHVEQIRKTMQETASPAVDQAFEPNTRFLVRCLILYRFLKRHLAG